jgi:hypothetical protein
LIRLPSRAAARGLLVKGEAQYQIQILYLWYEHKPAEALALIRQLQQRYPHNPLFRWIEADVLDVYFHDHTASLNASQELLSLALDGKVFRADLAERAARRNIATQIAAMKR